MELETLGQKLRFLRVERGWLLADVANRLDCTVRHLSDMERDRRLVTDEMLTKFAHIFEVEPLELFTLSGRIDRTLKDYCREHPSAVHLLRMLVSYRVSDARINRLIATIEKGGA